MSADKDFLKFCNSLRCPLCGSQLDGKIHVIHSQLYCVNNNDEYIVSYYSNLEFPQFEKIKYYYPQYNYIVISEKHHNDNEYYNTISRANTDNLPIYQVPELILEYNGDRPSYFRKRMEEKEFLNKLKLYLVFS